MLKGRANGCTRLLNGFSVSARAAVEKWRLLCRSINDADPHIRSGLSEI
jgi:hypothetical protein